MTKTVAKLLAISTAAALPIATPAAAEVLNYSYTTTVAQDGGRIFSGSFSFDYTAGVYRLTEFGGSYNGVQYNLNNVGTANYGDRGILIGGTQTGVTAVQGGTDDFFLAFFKKGATSLDYTLSRTGYGFASGTVALTQIGAAVPEPATWAMMIIGFGAIGFGMRSTKRRSDAKFDAKIKRITAGLAA